MMVKQPLSLNLNLLYRFVNQINRFRKNFLKIDFYSHIPTGHLSVIYFIFLSNQSLAYKTA